MSQRWASRAFGRISDDAMDEAADAVRKGPWKGGHDNLNIRFESYAQRLDNPTHFDSGTTASIFVKPFAPPEPTLNQADFLRARSAGRKDLLTYADILDLDVKAGPRLYERRILHVLQQLIHAPEFNFSSYSHSEDPLFARRVAVRQLPFGDNHVTQQYVLRTVHVDESTYEGTDALLTEFMRQLKLDTAGGRKTIGMGSVIPWFGDQLTVERLRGLANYRSEDLNGFDRMDWILPIFGWFHLLMALANSLHKQHFGTLSGRGLRQAFSNLQRKGLQTIQIKGNFYYTLHEGLTHVSEAHTQACVKKITGVASLRALREKTPQELYSIAKRVVDEYASNDALEDFSQLAEDEQDDFVRNATIWNRDIHYYLILRDAIRHGDVGVMEDMLSHLFFRFCGSSNHKYALEVLELMQGLYREWPESVR